MYGDGWRLRLTFPHQGSIWNETPQERERRPSKVRGRARSVDGLTTTTPARSLARPIHAKRRPGTRIDRETSQSERPRDSGERRADATLRSILALGAMRRASPAPATRLDRLQPHDRGAALGASASTTTPSRPSTARHGMGRRVSTSRAQCHRPPHDVSATHAAAGRASRRESRRRLVPAFRGAHRTRTDPSGGTGFSAAPIRSPIWRRSTRRSPGMAGGADVACFEPPVDTFEPAPNRPKRPSCAST